MSDRRNISTDSDVICAVHDMIRIVVRTAACEVIVADPALGAPLGPVRHTNDKTQRGIALPA